MMPKTEQVREELNALRALQDAKIERVVCSGGGAKGVVYPGAYLSLHETGVLSGVKQFSGASAGAITASLMAIGMPPVMLRDKLLNTNFKDLLGKTVHKIGRSNPGVTAMVTKDGKPLEDFVRSAILQTIKTYLEQLPRQVSHLTVNQEQALNHLRQKVHSDFPRITFGDLAVLNSIFPETFKQLTVTAVRFPDGTLQVFDDKNTPDVEIALACRASASIPVLLEPVEIEINGRKQSFMDGGLYDNLPTDYFDTNADGHYLPNQKPAKTLVFAFGEGLDNDKNQVFQALYGQRSDEMLDETILDNLLHTAQESMYRFIDPDDSRFLLKRQLEVFSFALKQTIEAQVQGNQLSSQQAKTILNASKLVFEELAEKAPSQSGLNSSIKDLSALSQAIKEKMAPVLFQANLLEQIKRDYLTKALGGLNAPYKNTAQKEAGYQRLRQDYALRTVELRVGDIKTTDFDKADTYARVMDNLGFLDTVNYLTNHDLNNPQQFDEKKFYQTITNHFQHIYTALLYESGEDPNKDKLMNDMNKLQKQLAGQPAERINRELYYLMKDYAEKQLNSPAAHALSRAVEFHHGQLTPEALFKDIYEAGFAMRGVSAVSKITGNTIYSAKTLHETLHDKNLFELYALRAKHKQPGRIDKTFQALQQLEGFKEAYTAAQTEKTKKQVNVNSMTHH